MKQNDYVVYSKFQLVVRIQLLIFERLAEQSRGIPDYSEMVNDLHYRHYLLLCPHTKVSMIFYFFCCFSVVVVVFLC